MSSVTKLRKPHSTPTQTWESWGQTGSYYSGSSSALSVKSGSSRPSRAHADSRVASSRTLTYALDEADYDTPSPAYISPPSTPNRSHSAFATPRSSDLPNPKVNAPPMSNAVVSSSASTFSALDDTESLRSSYLDFSVAPLPQTRREQYWTYRAMVAEKRAVELERISELLQSTALDTQRKYEVRVIRLELLLLGLISAITFIAVFLLIRHSGHPPNTGKSSFRPQFTIPILSPFSSIVEHESSKMSFRTTAMLIVASAVVAYASFRHWLSRRS